MLELWRKHPFPVPADDEIDPGLRGQLERYREGLGELAADLPLGLLLTFLRCWVRLYGIVSLEVFGHLGFALDDAEPHVRADAGGDGPAARPGVPAALAATSWGVAPEASTSRSGPGRDVPGAPTMPEERYVRVAAAAGSRRTRPRDSRAAGG